MRRRLVPRSEIERDPMDSTWDYGVSSLGDRSLLTERPPELKIANENGLIIAFAQTSSLLALLRAFKLFNWN